VLLERDDELLARDTRGPDDPGRIFAAHQVTSKRIGKAIQPRGKLPRERRGLALSTFLEHEHAHFIIPRIARPNMLLSSARCKRTTSA
jgi:hypothetical protein